MDYGKAEQGCPLFLFKQCLDLSFAFCLIEFVLDFYFYLLCS